MILKKSKRIEKNIFINTKKIGNRSRFKGSGVQGSILVHGLHLGCVFTRKASVLLGLIQNLKPNWQILGKMNICNEDFGSSLLFLSLTLNVEP
ncbi:MAG: hypothetical protein SRB2_02710 [Desulfobacteraceae bacterium Eth-SRB2]|nr:MAG: hypothetical protein SRB2_02710 [Desulfobacteraceae bacterium Eth-SRB2]